MTHPTPQKLLEQARAGHDPSPADEARVRAALHARVLANPLLLSSKSVHPLAGAAKLTWGKLVIALSLGSAAVVGAVVVSQGLGSRVPSQGARQAATAAASALPFVPPAPATPAAVPSAARVATADDTAPDNAAPVSSGKRALASPSVSVSASPNAGEMQLEIAGLGRAQQLLHSGNAAQALHALDQLSAQVPRGALMEERDATRALAQCALGRSSGVANTFLARHPKSVHAASVRAACTGAD